MTMMIGGAAAKVLLEKVDSLIQYEGQLLGGVHAGMKDMHYTLQSMKSFLEDVDADEKRDAVRILMNQVRELVYEIEDVIEESRHHLRQPHGSGLVGFLRKGVQNMKHLWARRRIATRIEKIKAEINNLSMRRNAFTINLMDEGTSFRAARCRLHDRHVAAPIAEESEIVGIEEPREKLVGWLLERENQPKVITVVGMGGVGKTTLVRKVYDDERVKEHFNCHAWIPVKRSSTIEEVLRSIVQRFYEETQEPLPGRFDNMEDDQLIEIIRRYLKDKMYIVVFDDVWHMSVWNCIKHAVPDDNRGSRVLITTRIRDIGRETSGQIYDLLPLPHEEAWHLFCKKTFGSIEEGACPLELKDLSQDFVRQCAGLPLAIVAIGGLLSKKERSVIEWNRFRNNLRSEFANNKNLEHIRVILSSSYNDLPQHLRNCFLHFGIFPKNCPVTRITLIRLWVAEGFIMNERGRTMEDVADGYLKDLIDRSMVQVAESYDYGRVRSCRVHDLIHDIIVLKSEEENFSTPFICQNLGMYETVRRLSIHYTQEDVLQNLSFSHLRALFICAPVSKPLIRKFFSGFRSLRVLNLEGAPIEMFPIDYANLRHLRYLSLRNTRIKTVSKSLGKLKYLETLDLKGTYVSTLPKEILKLKSHRHLLAYSYDTGCQQPLYYTYGVQKLSYLEANKEIVIVLGNLTQLKRLGLVKLRKEDGRNLCASIATMKQLHSFSVTSIDIDELLDLHSLSSAPPLLQRLYLRGPLHTLPLWVASLQNLVRMRLRDSRLGEDSLEVLQALPNLAELTLIGAYDGETLYCKEGGLQKLKILDLEQLESLNTVKVDGAMPNLWKMIIRNCKQLDRVPFGIKQLANLKELRLIEMPDQFVGKLQKKGGADRDEVEHIQIIQHYDKDSVPQQLSGFTAHSENCGN